jgi:hypothetical protein
MFVRWKKRQAKRGTTYSAYLVYSVRINDRPRQRVLEYLGCITHSPSRIGQEWQYKRCNLAYGEEPWPKFLSHMDAQLRHSLKEPELEAVHRQMCKVVPKKYHNLLFGDESPEKSVVPKKSLL